MIRYFSIPRPICLRILCPGKFIKYGFSPFLMISKIHELLDLPNKFFALPSLWITASFVLPLAFEVLFSSYPHVQSSDDQLLSLDFIELFHSETFFVRWSPNSFCEVWSVFLAFTQVLMSWGKNWVIAHCLSPLKVLWTGDHNFPNSSLIWTQICRSFHPRGPWHFDLFPFPLGGLSMDSRSLSVLLNFHPFRLSWGGWQGRAFFSFYSLC